MAGDKRALLAALQALVERHGRAQVEQAWRQGSPPKRRGRPPGAKYFDTDKELMLMAYSEYVDMVARFHRDPAGRHPKPTTYAALKAVAERAWAERPEWRGEASNPEALVKRLETRFLGRAQPKRVSRK